MNNKDLKVVQNIQLNMKIVYDTLFMMGNVAMLLEDKPTYDMITGQLNDLSERSLKIYKKLEKVK